MHTPTDDRHFLKSVTRLGDSRNIVSQRETTNDRGVKLLSAGSRISSAVYDKLLNHKLVPSLEQCLSVEDGVDHDTLVRDMAAEVERETSPFRAVAEALPVEWRRRILEQIPLPPAIAFKLTVAREERTELYQHSITLCALILYLCRDIGWNEHDTVNAAAAALLHDIGILHIDPELFAPGRAMTLAERRHLYAHPVVSHMIVSRFDDYPPVVAEAIAQHHERLDGSGYPKGLQREQIGKIGQLLGVAELLASRFSGEEGCRQCAQLDLILKLNAQRLNAEYALHLKPFFEKKPDEAAPSHTLAECRQRLLTLGRLFGDWRKIQIHHTPADRKESEQMVLIGEQLEALQRNLLQTGLILDEQAGIDWLEDDPEHLREIGFLLGEAGWQLSELYYLLHRRWPEPGASGELGAWIARLRQVFTPAAQG